VLVRLLLLIAAWSHSEAIFLHRFCWLAFSIHLLIPGLLLWLHQSFHFYQYLSFDCSEVQEWSGAEEGNSSLFRPPISAEPVFPNTVSIAEPWFIQSMVNVNLFFPNHLDVF